VATTDARKGALRQLAARSGYETFIVPDDVGGRFSVLTPVGLLPLAVAGVDVDALLGGAALEARRCSTEDADAESIPSVRYAAARHALLLQGFAVEVLAGFHPSLHYVAEWWKQLFGESEGKRGRGLFPASVDYTSDLHSMGQYMQQGRRFLLETFLDAQQAPAGPPIPALGEDLDGLEYLAGRSVGAVNAKALEAVAAAHQEGGVPNMTVQLPRLDARSLGSLLYFFQHAVAVGGRLLGVNPFDQPGVEAYKTNLFRLLGKPGFGDGGS
jgi:glucose-6-phosphate isomerase